MGMMYFESYACISLIVHPLLQSLDPPLGPTKVPRHLDRRKRCEKFTETQTNSANGTVHHLQKEGKDEEQGLECYLCDQWKHIECVWSVDRPSESMYEALTEIRSKAILYVCFHCCK